MYRTVRTLALCAGIAVCAGAVASAETLSGQITRVDAKAKTLAVKGSGPKAARFSLARDAKVVNGTAPSDFASLKKGEQVTVEYAVDHGKRVASRIEITAPAGRSAAPAAPAHGSKGAH